MVYTINGWLFSAITNHYKQTNQNMILLEFLGKLFIEILFEGIILGFFRLLGKGFSGSALISGILWKGETD